MSEFSAVVQHCLSAKGTLKTVASSRPVSEAAIDLFLLREV